METKRSSPIYHLRGAFEFGKWWMKLKRLNKERGGKAQERSQAIAALGAHAWELQLREEVFASVFDQLAVLEQERAEIRGEMDELEASIRQRESEKQHLEQQFGARIAELEAELKMRTEQGNEALGARKAAEKTRRKLQSQQKSVRKALEAARANLRKAESAPADAPERTRIDALRNEIAESERVFTDLGEQISQAGEEVTRRTAVATQRQTAVDQQRQALASERDQCARALRPLVESWKQAREQRAAAERKLATLDEQKARGLAELGVQVHAARPAAPELSEDADRIHDPALQR